MKSIKIITALILITFIIVMFFSTKTYAIDEIFSAGNNFLSAGDDSGTISDDDLKEASSKIYNILLGIGVVVAVVVGAVLGISFIYGSAEGKAKISEALVPYIIGCFIVFGAFGIWKLAINMGNDIIDISGGGSVESPQANKSFRCAECGAEKSLSANQLQMLETKGTLRCNTCNKQTSWTEVR